MKTSRDLEYIDGLEITLQRYAKFQPTVFDCKGLLGEYHGIDGFYVAASGRNRDSGILDESNFACTLEALGGESDTVQVHRFGHWANGWFEIILIDPTDRERVKIAQEIADGLEDYPLVNDTDHSEREWNQIMEYWQRASTRERVEWLQRADLNVFAARRDEFPEDSNGRLYELLTRDC